MFSSYEHDFQKIWRIIICVLNALPVAKIKQEIHKTMGLHRETKMQKIYKWGYEENALEKIAPKDGNIAWNRAQNDTDPFEYISWTEVDNQGLMPVLLEGLKSVAALGLDFGGIDVMLFEGEAYVLELNTAPTLNTSPYVAERWGKYFD